MHVTQTEAPVRYMPVQELGWYRDLNLVPLGTGVFLWKAWEKVRRGQGGRDACRQKSENVSGKGSKRKEI